MFDTSNPAYFFFDVMKRIFLVLSQYNFIGISLTSWLFGFVAVGILVSVFWKGARG